MGAHVHIKSPAGFSLLELMLVLGVMGVCLALGGAAIGDGLRAREARGAAQSWQVGAPWAQLGVLWHGGTSRVEYGPEGFTATHDLGLCGGDLGAAALDVPVSTNLFRWKRDEGTVVSFGGGAASPDGGGSLYFGSPGALYRVVVRPESGLTVRSREGDGR